MIRIIAGLLLVAFTVVGCSTGPYQNPQVNGVITYRGDPPPRRAILEVRIVENANWPNPFVVGTYRIVNMGPSPARFVVNYKPREIDANKQYLLEADIILDGRIVATNNRPYFVITGGYNSRNLEVPLRRL